jgi:hypothetical protein
MLGLPGFVLPAVARHHGELEIGESSRQLGVLSADPT